MTVSASTASAGDFGLNGTLAIEGLDYNDAAANFERLDWTTAFDLDGDGAADLLNPGEALPTAVDLTIDLPSTLEFRVSGSVTGLSLTVGVHTITAAVTDGDAGSGSAQITVTINAAP